MGLLDTLFGSAPSVSKKTKFTAQDVVGDVQGTYAPFVQQQGQNIGQQLFGQSASFGPGFQGGMQDAMARAQQGNLLQYLLMAMQGRSQGTEFVTNPGTGGLIGPVLAGLSGGVGMGLGAKLLGGAGGAVTGMNPGSSLLANLGQIPGQSGAPSYGGRF